MATEIDDVMAKLERLGVIRRWWCEVCQDHVPYRCLEMGEAESRREHSRAHKAKKAPTDA